MGDFSEIANNSAGTPATTKHTDGKHGTYEIELFK